MDKAGAFLIKQAIATADIQMEAMRRKALERQRRAEIEAQQLEDILSSYETSQGDPLLRGLVGGGVGAGVGAGAGLGLARLAGTKGRWPALAGGVLGGLGLGALTATAPASHRQYLEEVAAGAPIMVAPETPRPESLFGEEEALEEEWPASPRVRKLVRRLTR